MSHKRKERAREVRKGMEGERKEGRKERRRECIEGEVERERRK